MLLDTADSTFDKSNHRSSEHLSPFQNDHQLNKRDWPRLEEQGRWPQARTRLHDHLARRATTVETSGRTLIDPYLLVIGRKK
ncbi:hypothetical protein [Nocardia barduliensis]|uniref:hypothetical protein n=1 Tax=Nocardia barduliensis TaxID=2736643 RepID=UPI001572E515|nr:hypothetical protein [Nocardia barduliensis]